MSAKTSEEVRNEQVVRSLYALAEGNAKDTSKFVSTFTDDGYFYDVAADKKYFGRDIGVTADVYAAAFPDMHREIYALRSFGDHVLVELSLNGTHKGDLVIPAGTIPPTGKVMRTPCCDVFRLKDGRVFSFHCYVAVPILLEQLGLFTRSSGAISEHQERRSFGLQGRKDATGCLAVEFRVGHAHLSLCEGKTERVRRSASAAIARHEP
jgi:ketosteroid isomerase-like protein